MAGPWTISPDRPAASQGQDLGAVLGQVGSQTSQTPLIGPLAESRTRGRRLSGKAWWAAPLIALMTAAAVAITWATVSLAEQGFAAAHAAASVRGGPLVAPAPRSAGGMPRRFSITLDPASQVIISQFDQRFAAVSAQLLSSARHVRQDGQVTTVRPAGLYGQPGHLDPLTSRPSWVMYLGLQSSARLGQPINTIGSLMMGILGRYSKIGPWPVAAGRRGGQVNCTVAWLGGTEVSVCGWATDRTIGVVASPTRETSVAELATLLIQMRHDLQRG